MKNIKGHLRCTTVEEVKKRITSEALREYYDIQKKMDEERKSGHVTSSLLEQHWIDKYNVNPYKVNNSVISFLLTKDKACEVIYYFDENYTIMDVQVISR